jgi:hypothetical protein
MLTPVAAMQANMPSVTFEHSAINSRHSFVQGGRMAALAATQSRQSANEPSP